MTESDSKVTVRGEAVVSGRPDEVVLSLAVTAVERSPEEALEVVARRSEELEAILAESGVEPDRWTTSGLSVAEEREYEKNRWVNRGYRATNAVTVRLSEASGVGRLMREATSRTSARVDGPWWRIAPDNPARGEACRRAAAEARRKAEAYAEALGMRLGRVRSVTEPGLTARHDVSMRPLLRAAPQALAAPEPAEVPVQSGELDVGAAVEVTFELQDLGTAGP